MRRAAMEGLEPCNFAAEPAPCFINNTHVHIVFLIAIVSTKKINF
jgi:hypothetical protein